MPRCESLKVDGKRCTKNAQTGKCFCAYHQKRLEVQDAKSLTGKSPVDSAPPSPHESQNRSPMKSPIGSPNSPIGLAKSSAHTIVLLTQINELQATITRLIQEKETLKTTCLELEGIVSKQGGTILDLERSLARTQKQKKSQRQRTQNEEYFAKLAFYHHIKSNKDEFKQIQSDIRTRLETSGIGFSSSKVPWTLIKEISDQRFVALTPEEKQKFLEAANLKYLL